MLYVWSFRWGGMASMPMRMMWKKASHAHWQRTSVPKQKMIEHSDDIDIEHVVGACVVVSAPHRSKSNCDVGLDECHD